MLRLTRLITPLVLLILLNLAPTARAEVLPDGYPFRRPLTFKQTPSDAPGDNLAWAEFYANGAQLPDGSDFRVTTADRVILPAKVLFSSPDHDLVRIAFATRGDGPCYVWWGNPKPEKPGPELDIKRGILAQVFRFPGGPANDEHAVRQAFDKAKTPVGSVFVPELFLGHNPLGEEWTAMIRYLGQFKIDKPAAYDIAFSVGDRGYLAIDGQTVLFQHGMVRDARHTKSIDLKAGWDTIEVTQINVSGGETGISCSYRKAGDKNFTPIPGALFAPAAEAAAGPLENVKQPYTADFDLAPVAETFIPPAEYAQRYAFDAYYPATYKPTLTWDFGDGQITRDIKRVHHIFLTPGVYKVTLTVTQGPATFTATRRIDIKDRMYAKFPRPQEDPFKTTQAVLEKYNLTKLSAEQRLRGLNFFFKHNDSDGIIAWGQAWLEARDAQSDGVVLSTTFDLARLYESKKMFKEAAEAYRLCSAKQISPPVRAAALRQYVMALCDSLDDSATALKAISDFRRNTSAGNKEVLFTLSCAEIYADVAAADGKAADKLADDIGTRKSKPYNQQQIEQGVLTRNIENYIRTRDFDTAIKLLNEWEFNYPETITDGYSRLLRVKLLVAQDEPALAARVALQHAKAFPSKFYAAELLYRAAEAFKAANKPDEAKSTMDLLKSKYPESPYAREKDK